MSKLGLGLALNKQRTIGGPAVSLTRDMLAWWKFEDANASQGSFNLTNNNAVTFTAGKVNNAATFAAASSQTLSKAISNGELNILETSFTMGGWLKRTDTSTRGIVSVGTTGTNGFKCWSSSGGVNLQTYGIGNVGTTTTNGNLSTSYVFVMYWYSSAGSQGISVNNGADVTTSLSGGLINGASGTLRFGYQDLNYFDGQMDEWFFINRLLTTAEKAYLYNSGSGRTWPLT